MEKLETGYCLNFGRPTSTIQQLQSVRMIYALLFIYWRVLKLCCNILAINLMIIKDEVLRKKYRPTGRRKIKIKDEEDVTPRQEFPVRT